MTRKEKLAHKAKMDAFKAAAQKIVAGGKCPDCGSPLRRNTALAGWFQCERFGTDNFRKPEFRGLPSCLFQTFTE